MKWVDLNGLVTKSKCPKGDGLRWGKRLLERAACLKKFTFRGGLIREGDNRALMVNTFVVFPHVKTCKRV